MKLPKSVNDIQRRKHQQMVGGLKRERLDRSAEMTEKAGAVAMGENYEPKRRGTLNFGPCLPLPLYPRDAPRGARVIQHNRHVVALAGPSLGKEWGGASYLGLFRLADTES